MTISTMNFTFCLLQAIVFLCISSHTNAWPRVGDIANTNPQCVRAAGDNVLDEIFCTAEFRPVCAKFSGMYLQDNNICKFCRRFGRTPALILQIGAEPGRNFTCKAMQPGDIVLQDPECRFWFGKTDCTEELRPYCATIDNYKTYIEGDNKCLFCSVYGRTNARVLSIGIADQESCIPFQIGTRARDDLGCRYLATRVSSTCTFELNPVCGILPNGAKIRHLNKCLFCTQFGNTDAVIRRCLTAE